MAAKKRKEKRNEEVKPRYVVPDRDCNMKLENYNQPDRYYRAGKRVRSVIHWDDLPDYVSPASRTSDEPEDDRVKLSTNEEVKALSEMVGPYQRIRDALKLLDPEEDEHWTLEGVPRAAAVNAVIVGGKVNAAQIKEANPGFNRILA